MKRILEPSEALCNDDAQVYDSLSQKHWFWVDRPFVQKAAQLAAGRKLALDIGCGPGHVAVALAKRCPHLTVYALDPSETMLDIVGRNAQKAGVAERVKPIQGDACDLPFTDDSFDLVLSLHAWHHLPEPRPALREIQRILAPKGACMIRDLRRPQTKGSTDRLVAIFGSLLGYSTEERLQYFHSLRAAFTLDEMKAWAREAGLSHAHITKQRAQHLDLIVKPSLRVHHAQRTVSTSSPLRWAPPLAAAAAALLLLASGVLMNSRPSAKPVRYGAGLLQQASGTLAITDTPQSDGILTTIESSADSFGHIDNADGTRLALAEHTQLEWHEPNPANQKGKIVNVRQGQIYLDVAPQQKPLEVHFGDDSMKAEVLGTRLLAGKTASGAPTVHLLDGRVRIETQGIVRSDLDTSTSTFKRINASLVPVVLLLQPGQSVEHQSVKGRKRLYARVGSFDSQAISWLGKTGIDPESLPSHAFAGHMTAHDQTRLHIAMGTWRLDQRDDKIVAVFPEPKPRGGALFLGDEHREEGELTYSTTLPAIKNTAQIGIAFRSRFGDLAIGKLDIYGGPAGIYHIRARFKTEQNSIMVHSFELWPQGQRKRTYFKNNWRLFFSDEKITTGGSCVPGIYIASTNAEFYDFDVKSIEFIPAR